MLIWRLDISSGKIVPLLQRELGKAEGRLLATQRELSVSRNL